jgi:hypothetical protein
MMQQDNSTSAREPSPTNPVRAFLSATVPLRGCDLSDDDACHHGRDLVAIMAAQLEQTDDPTLQLNVSDCADVLEFLADRQAIVDADVAWTAGSPLPDELTAKYGGDLAPSRILTRARCEGTAAEAVAQ